MSGFIALSGMIAQAQDLLPNLHYVSTTKSANDFVLYENGMPAPLYIDTTDDVGVIRAFRDLQHDFEKVTGQMPQWLSGPAPKSQFLIIAGTIGKNPVIDKLVKQKKIDVRSIQGKWESYMVQVIKKPWKGVAQALVITGSDKRGTIYGIYDLSQQIGVSPWYWWADVPVQHHKSLYAKPGTYIQGPPSVKYRGIFLNDEYPDLTRWIAGKYGYAPESSNPPVPKGIANYNHEFYAHIFELLLRLKGNYLWPAMWNNAFNEDDQENPKLANEYGIVMGTSHQEPMLRAQKEWDRRYIRTLGTWNYATHADVLENFWREGVRRNKNYESIVTMGLRGANDTEMAPGGPEANMALLEKIVKRQRQILTEEINPDITKIPQMWCLYKEVQDFYEAGMRVPDDVTLLWAEDNWGNVRRLPTPAERQRTGGAGIYYHFDYHGGPRSYQWINTNPISKIWDQMSLAKQYGADRIWIVNVGHFKGYEFPLEFFMDLAWNSNLYTGSNLREYTRQWAAREFGPDVADETANIIAEYTRYNGRRKPELLSTKTYSLVNYNEAERVAADFQKITSQAEKIYHRLSPEKKDAFYELVLFPTKASAIVNEIYLAAAKNQLYAAQGRASANDFAEKTRSLFSADTSLMGYFNRDFAGGKWNHFMDQTHLGYMAWNDPPQNSLRAIKLTETTVPDTALMGVSIEGSTESWPGSSREAILPEFDIFNHQARSVEVFNKGNQPFEFTAATNQPWIILSKDSGAISKEIRIAVKIDWEKVPAGKSEGEILINGTNQQVNVKVTAFDPKEVTPATLDGFVESNGYVSIEAEHFTQNKDAGENKWVKIEDFGHTLSGMRANAPANAPAAVPGQNSPCLEYRMFLFSAGTANITAITSPVLNFIPDRPVRYAVSFDDQTPQIITLVPEKYSAQNGNRNWERAVSDNSRHSVSTLQIPEPGYHTLKIWMIDPGPVLEKIIVSYGELQPSYLGPPESFYRFPNQ